MFATRAGAIAHLMDLDEIGRRFSQCRRTNISERCCRAATTGAVQQPLHNTRHRAAPSLARSLRWLLPPVARTLRSLDRERSHPEQHSRSACTWQAVHFPLGRHLSREQPRHIRTVLYCIAHAIDDCNLRWLQRRLAGNPSRAAHFASSGLMVRVQRDVNHKLAIKIRLEDSQMSSSSKCRTPSDSYAAMPPD